MPSHLGPRQTKHGALGIGGLSPFQRDSCDRAVVLPAPVILPCISFYEGINICGNTYTYIDVVFLKAPGPGGNRFFKNLNFQKV